MPDEMVPTLEISSAIRDAIVAQAAQSPDAEICGLLFGSPARIDYASPCRNVADDPAVRFEIDPAALLAAHRGARAGGPAVVGHYHSHPTGQAGPSPRDAADAAPDGSIWLIVAHHDVTAWRAVADGVIQGRFDTLRLVVG